MNCRYVHARLSAYIDGELPGNEMLAIRSHVSRCSECEQEEKELRSCKRLMGAMPLMVPSDGFEDRLLRAVRTSEPKALVWRSLRFAPYVTAVAAVALVAVLVGRVKQDSQPNANPAVSQSFELSRDQAYVAGADPLGVGPVAIPTSYAKR